MRDGLLDRAARRVRPLPRRTRRAVIIALLGGAAALTGGWMLAVQGLLGDGVVNWGLVVVGALSPVIGAVVGGAAPRWARRVKVGTAEREQMRPFWTATRTGRLPARVDPAEWRPLLLRELAANRRRMPVRAAVWAAVGVGWLVLVVTALDVGLLPVLTWTLLWGQVVSWSWAAGRRREERLSGLLARLPVPSESVSRPG
ncbi:hypothetical protein [Modestobacter roseus]|uniref:hypothetical protein n=1 Tax=Modestobacter roseus TaxID=1181884 RepID=UPI0034E01283